MSKPTLKEDNIRLKAINKELLEACKWALKHLKDMGYTNGEGDFMDTLTQTIAKAENNQ